MPILIEQHNPTWLLEFLRTKKELENLLKGVQIVSIEHVGSTAIPSLVAKPVIDIDVVVKPENLSAARKALSVSYQDMGEMGVPGRVAFRRLHDNSSSMRRDADATSMSSASTDIRRNLYVVLENCISLRNHLDLRRILSEDEQLREEYGEVKKAIVATGIDDVDEYCRGKNEVILKILRTAGWTEEDLEEVRKANE